MTLTVCRVAQNLRDQSSFIGWVRWLSGLAEKGERAGVFVAF
jgi:hypothetical protein